MIVPVVLALPGMVGSFDEPGESAGAKKAPRALGWFEEGNDECLVGKFFIIATGNSYADRRKPPLAAYFVTDSNVVVQFVSVKIGKPTRAVTYGISIPLLAGLHGSSAKVRSPFGLMFYK